MNSKKCGASHCGYCRFYTPTGRRGGDCAQLNVPVKARWTACHLAQSPFESNEISFPDIVVPWLPRSPVHATPLSQSQVTPAKATTGIV